MKKYPSEPENWLTYAGGQLLEYAYLVHLTQDEHLKKRMTKMRYSLLELDAEKNGLYMDKISVSSGMWMGSSTTISWTSRHVSISYLKKTQLSIYKQLASNCLAPLSSDFWFNIT